MLRWFFSITRINFCKLTLTLFLPSLLEEPIFHFHVYGGKCNNSVFFHMPCFCFGFLMVVSTNHQNVCLSVLRSPKFTMRFTICEVRLLVDFVLRMSTPWKPPRVCYFKVVASFFLVNFHYEPWEMMEPSIFDGRAFCHMGGETT